AFEVIGGGGILFAVLYFTLVPNRALVRDAGGATKATASHKAPMRELMKNPILWQLLIVWFCLSCVNKGLDSWMPIYLLQQRGLDLKAVGLLTPIPFVLATISTAIG